jgi:hypothetical protein
MPTTLTDLRDYFENACGIGVLATADAEGKVNAAIYARPYFLDENDDATIALIMSDRMSHDNVLVNPNASYLFIEEGEDYLGRRLSLVKIGEDADEERIRSVCRRKCTAEDVRDKTRFLVFFRVESVRPLIGTGD